MKSVLVTIFLFFGITILLADVFDDLERELVISKKYCAGGVGRVTQELNTKHDIQTGKIISEALEDVVYCRTGSRHVVSKKYDENTSIRELKRLNLILDAKKYKCIFEKSFLIGMCEGKKYFYVEQKSSTKRKKLTEFYRFVESSNGGEIISDTCVDISSKESTDTLINCHDFGIVLMRDNSYTH